MQLGPSVVRYVQSPVGHLDIVRMKQGAVRGTYLSWLQYCWLRSFSLPCLNMSYLRPTTNKIARNDELKIDLTSNPLVSSAIFFEYSRSATRTLFSICSVFAWTSFLTAISLSTAASKERMNGFGSNAIYVLSVKILSCAVIYTHVHCLLSISLLVFQMPRPRTQWHRIFPSKKSRSVCKDMVRSTYLESGEFKVLLRVLIVGMRHLQSRH